MPRLPSLSLVGDTAIDYRVRYELVLTVENLDLTGATAIAQLCTQSGKLVLPFAVTITVVSPVLAAISFVLEAATQVQTTTFSPGVYDWDVLLLLGDGVAQYLFGGKVVVNRRLSHVAA